MMDKKLFEADVKGIRPMKVIVKMMKEEDEVENMGKVNILEKKSSNSLYISGIKGFCG